MQVKATGASDFVELRKELAELPFWRKPELWKKMREDRKVPVSVTHAESKWHFKGAGIVKAPLDFCFEKTKEFDRLGKIPDHFKEVSFDPSTSILQVKIQFLGRTRAMSLHISEETSAESRRLYFRSVQGWFKGLEGALVLKDHERQETEIGIYAVYPGAIDWMPNWVFSLAAEGVMHHVAESLRKSLEADYKMTRGERSGVERNQDEQKDSKTALGS